MTPDMVMALTVAMFVGTACLATLGVFGLYIYIILKA